MTLKKLIEYVQQHHPHMGETEIVDRVNRYLTSVARAYDIMESSWSQELTAGQRYYTLSEINADIQDVKDVYINRKKIPRIEKPILEDDNEPGSW